MTKITKAERGLLGIDTLMGKAMKACGEIRKGFVAPDQEEEYGPNGWNHDGPIKDVDFAGRKIGSTSGADGWVDPSHKPDMDTEQCSECDDIDGPIDQHDGSTGSQTGMSRTIITKALIASAAIIAKAGWDESKHKRDGGKFTSGGLGQTSTKPYLDAQKPRQSSYAQMESDSYEARNGHKRPRDMREHE